MKKTTITSLSVLLLAGVASAGQGLYSVGQEPEDSIPIKWLVGLNAVYDDNVTPGGAADGEDSIGINPYVNVSLINFTPQTIVEAYARLGVMYYLDAPDAIDDENLQSHATLNVYHNLNQRMTFKSKNTISYELEPNYAYGYASSRVAEEHLHWLTDQSLTYDWTSRFATTTGFQLTALDYEDSTNLNRQTWMGYNQFRYKLNQQTVLTSSYRYSDSNGEDSSSDTTNQYILVGAEHRFSPNTIGQMSVGAQLRDVEDGDDNTNPYAEASLISNVNSQLKVRGFVRYSVEDYDTVQSIGGDLVEYDERNTLRIGVSGNYKISPKLSAFSGVDYIPTDFSGARAITGAPSLADQSEDVINAYIGFALQLTDNIEGSVSYNFTESDSDLVNRDYERNRVSVGVSASF